MVTKELLDKIRLDRFYQAGTVLSFIIFLTSLTVPIRILNNQIISLYALSSLTFFFGTWMSITQEMGIFKHRHYTCEKYKLSVMGIGSYILSIISMGIAIFLTIQFFK
ncbi:MAG: hypothetical protein ABFQ65_00830 [Nanoarchaeota archaeon]